MTASAGDIILHHYDTSPFAEKARLMLGLKGLSWHSVEIPFQMPKPDLMPLTGGYRKTPVLQIGADIYCDTQLIAQVLEDRAPAPSLFDGSAGLHNAYCMWTDKAFFMATVGVSFAAAIDVLPADFIEDRMAFSGGAWSRDGLKAAAPHLESQLGLYMIWLDDQLADGRPFLFGPKAGLADFGAYMNFWFLDLFQKERKGALVERCPHLAAWAERVKAVGHGARAALEASEALETARTATPLPAGSVIDGGASGLAAGAHVTVTPDDTGPVPVAGTLVGLTAERITIAREDKRAGHVHVHFPRAGFILAPAAS